MKNIRYLLLCGVMVIGSYCWGQKKDYKDTTICISWHTYKGKKNHGEKYCTGEANVRIYKNGKRDTTSLWFSGTQLFIVDEYEKYKKLSERGQYIVDSLKEDGIPQLQNDYLTYESIYMKQGEKKEWFYSIDGKTVTLFQYKIWNKSKRNGYELISTKEIK